MKRLSRKTIQRILCLVDILSAFVAIWLALFLRNFSLPSFSYWWHHVTLFAPLFLLGICIFYLAGLYVVTKPVRNHILIIKLSMIGTLGWLIGFAFFYFSLNAIKFPKTILLLFWGAFCSLVFIIRKILFYIIFSRHQIPVVFLGDTISYEELSKDLIDNSMFGYKPIFIYHGIKDKDSLLSIIKTEGKGDSILYIYKLSTNILEGLSDVLKSLIAEGNQFIEYSDFYEYIERKIPPEDISESWFLSNITLYRKRYYFIIKRFFDIILSLTGIVLTIWLWPILALIICVDSKGGAFFVQKREGCNGNVFNLLKFRSMRTIDNDGTATEKNDMRITKVGKILRVFRLDELPQLLNVLKGDMSLIGPRPERPELAVGLEKEVPWYKQRLLVRPGITGWDQVCGEYHSPSKEDTYKKLQNDLYYIKNCSVSLDISIIFKTISTVVHREGR